MKNIILTTLKVFFVFSILLGIFYPLFITAIAQLTMKEKANGSLIIKNGEIIGSRLIGQSFKDPKYFHSRPSAVDYNGQSSGGSNLGPTSKKLIERVQKSINDLRIQEKLNKDTLIPSEMVLESASGLDPHICIKNALLQLPRIAEARGLSEFEIKKLIIKATDTDFLGIWGESSINVLELNLALDSHN